MKAMLKLESIGDDQVQKSKHNLGYRLLGMKYKPRCWVARITGRDPKFGFKRDFVRGQKEYAEANSQGSRGVYYYFFLNPGIYEINEPISWKNDKRYFVRSQGGRLTEITKDELQRELGARDFLRI